jgi:polar amino acid transport system substrate-binding protein
MTWFINLRKRERKIMKNPISLKILLFISSFLTLQVTHAKDKITVITEDFVPPFNMVENKQTVGISTDIMKELLKREKIEFTLEVFPWARGYKMALNEPNTALYSTTRTPERETLFKWVGPLASNDWVMFGKKGTKIKLNNLEDAKKYTVGVYNGNAITDYLIKKGFQPKKNLDIATNDQQSALKLEAGRIDLWASGSILGPWTAKRAKAGQLTPLLTFEKTELYAAFHKSASDEFIKKLNTTLKKMKDDGTVAKISNKYLGQ